MNDAGLRTGMGMPASEHLRKMLTGVCLILSPVALLVGLILHPEESRITQRQLEIIGADPQRWAQSHWIIAASLVLLIPALLGLAHLLRRRAPASAFWGGLLAFLGLMALFAVATAEALVVSELGRSYELGGVPLVFEKSTRGLTFKILLGVTLALPLGLLIMAIGLLRARVTAAWSAVAIMLGALVIGVSLPLMQPVAAIAGVALFVIGMGSIGWMILMENDEEWQTTPSLDDFADPMSGMSAGPEPSPDS